MHFFIISGILEPVIKMENIIITQLYSTVTVHAQKGKVFQKTDRECFSVSLCISGQITYTMGNKTFVSTPDVAVLLPKGITYSLHADKAGLFPLVSFDCKGLPTDSIAVLPLTDPAACVAIYERINSLMWKKDGQLAAYSALYALLDKVFTPQQTNPRLSPAISYIADHLSEPALCNRQLAELLGISEVYLRKLFLAKYGTTPRQYILDQRISAAKQYLTDTAMGVTDISEICGFSSVYHFCRAFKEKNGLTPTQYAGQNRIFRL